MRRVAWCLLLFGTGCNEGLQPKVLDLRAVYHARALRVALLAQNALNYIYNLVPRTLAPVRAVSVTVTWTY
jgi:hypothetical protein